MCKEILSTNYYEKLLTDFAKNKQYNSELLQLSNFNKINLSYINKAIDKTNGFNLVISIPKNYQQFLSEIYSNLYLFIANQQFYESYSTPDYKLNELLIERNTKKARQVKVLSINNGIYKLQHIKRNSIKDQNEPAIYERKYDEINKLYYKIQRGMRRQLLKDYIKLFCLLNKLDESKDLIPTEFNSVSIFIGARTLWDEFKTIPLLDNNLWNSTPCHYINREGNKTPTLGINPLIYFAPSYHIAYQEIIQRSIKVSNIVLFDDGYDELTQIINDQNQYYYRVIGVNTKPIEKHLPQIKYWEWCKEEINIIESL